MPLKDDVQAEAQSLGFSLTGFSLPGRPLTYAAYERWLQAGRHGSMQYLDTDRARQRRADPRLILPGARSILSLGLRYPSPSVLTDRKSERPTGRVAAYAWGSDYHDIIPPRLNALLERIQSMTGKQVPWRGYTDTGPILERDAAQQAGLGWIGKNTCLISPQQGSYFLLAEMLLDLEVEPDTPLNTDHCGSCTRCIEACPTGCILPDRSIDATRCISYQTIENKGAIPAEIRPQMGNWVFGCDVCQQVCPWNIRFAAPQGDPAFEPRAEIPYPDLRNELKLTPQEFNYKFKGSPIKRPKRRGYLRNVTVALGNSRDADAVPDLDQVMHEEFEPLIRSHAAWALGQIGSAGARLALDRARSLEEDSVVLGEIEQALERLA